MTTFGVGTVSTPNLVPFAVVAAASARGHNTQVPITVYIDEPSPQMQRLAPVMGIDVERLVTGTDDVWTTSQTERDAVSARVMKMKSILRTGNDPYLYLDPDTVVLGDVTEIVRELGDGTRSEVFLLPDGPEPTVWGRRHYDFCDPGIDPETATRLVNDAYRLCLPTGLLQELRCWNGSVVYGSASALRLLANRWLELYRRMLGAPNRMLMFPRDELSLSVAAWELRDLIRVRQLPRRWSFAAGQVLGLAAGTPLVDDSVLDGARVLRLAGNRLDAWALRYVDAALNGLDIQAPSGRTS